MRKSDPDSFEVALAGFIGLVTLLAGAYLLAPLRDQEPRVERQVKTLNELRPSPKYWYEHISSGGSQ